jgi:hypothetical protein
MPPAGAQTASAGDRPYPGDLLLPERNTAWPGPDSFQIGNAVSPVNYWMTAWMLADVMKMAGFENEIGDVSAPNMWAPVVDGEWSFDLNGSVQTDAQGWPLTMELDNGVRADRLVTIVMGGAEVPDAFPEGNYELLYEGSGEILVEGGMELVEEEPGRMVYSYDGGSTVHLYILETDPEDHLRNFRMYRPDTEPGQTFVPSYIEYLKPYSVIRPLHFFGDQLTYGPRVAWEGRKPYEYSHWGGALGAPYELGFELANESNSDLWLNIPIAADDGFVAQLARLALEMLDSNRKVYIELGNELWNFTFPYALGRDYALEQARLRWPDVEGTVQPYTDGDEVYESMMIHSWEGARTVEVSRIFKEEWGSEADRVIAVATGQIGGSFPFYYPSRLLLECPVYVGEEGGEPCGDQVDAFGVAPYVGEYEGEVEFDRSSPEAFFSEAISYVRGEGPWGPDSEEMGIRYLIRSDKALADEFGLPLISYEGGQHFVGDRYSRDVVNVHPLMRELYDALFEVWREEGGGLFVHLGGVIPRGRNEPGTEPTYFQSENFGIKELQTQTRAEAPKWDAVLTEMEEAGQIEAR